MSIGKMEREVAGRVGQTGCLILNRCMEGGEIEDWFFFVRKHLVSYMGCSRLLFCFFPANFSARLK
jgi:hypothetical protein